MNLLKRLVVDVVSLAVGPFLDRAERRDTASRRWDQ